MTFPSDNNNDLSEQVARQQFTVPLKRVYRYPAVEITPKTGADVSENVPKSIDSLVENTLSHNLVDRLEFLSMPDDADTYQAQYLVPHSHTFSLRNPPDHADSRSGSQMTLYDTPQQSDDHVSKWAQKQAKPITEYFEDSPHYDYKVGTLDLSGLTDKTELTSRLLAYQNKTVTTLPHSSSYGAASVITRLLENDIPHILQTIIEPASSRNKYPYTAVVRLTVFDPKYGVITDEDFKQHQDEQYPFDIATGFESSKTSNFNLNISTVKKALQRSSGYFRSEHILYDQPDTLRALATTSEYEELISASSDEDRRYKDLFNKRGRISIPAGALPSVAPIMYVKLQWSPWDRSIRVQKPTFKTTYLSSSSETADRFGTDTPPDTSPDRNQSPSEAHYAAINTVIDELHSSGYTILAVDQTEIDAELDPNPTTTQVFPGQSRPDIVTLKDDCIRCFEIEINTTNPATYLKNLARAHHYGYQVAVVTQSIDEIESKYQQAEQPYAEEQSPHGVLLYNFSEYTVGNDTTTYLLPPDVTEAQWYLSVDGTLSLVGNDTVLAQGDPNAPLSAFDYETPRCVYEQGEYVVKTASGEHITSAPTEQEALTNFIPIRVPFIPERLMYLNNVEFYYLSDTGQLTRWRANPDWATPTAPGTRHKKAAETFVNTATTESDGATLHIPDVRSTMEELNWFTHQTSLKRPPASWFTRGLRAEFDISPTDTRERNIRNRTWQFPRGLDPALPDFPDPTTETVPHDELPADIDLDLELALDADLSTAEPTTGEVSDADQSSASPDEEDNDTESASPDEEDNDTESASPDEEDNDTESA